MKYVETLITAQEAYPAFERRLLAARHSVTMGFRVFDPLTRLRSTEAQQIGETWFDLLVDTLNRGVDITLFLSDFDPLVATDLHRRTWRSVRLLCAIPEIAARDAGRLVIRPELHPARIGAAPAILTAPLVMWRKGRLRKRYALATDPAGKTTFSELPGVRYALSLRDPRLPGSFPASHHQKVAVIDDRWTYIGGLDLDERRFDCKAHDRQPEDTWHDVQLLIEDESLARAARAHLEEFTAVTAGKHPPSAQVSPLVRTMSSARRPPDLWAFSPRPVITEIYDAHLRAITSAQHLIYLETQYFRETALARALARRAREAPDLRLVLILPGAPDTVAFRKTPGLDGRVGDYLQAKCIRILRKAFGPRLVVASPAQPRTAQPDKDRPDRATLQGAPVVYVHAKVSVFDDRSAIVSSANLNGRSMKWDTELGVDLTDSDEVRKVRQRCVDHWLDQSQTGTQASLEDSFARLRKVVAENAKKPPAERNGFLVPYDLRAAEDTAMAMPGVPDEMV
ncbi:phospholipase D-like domain-containing protein [Shimia sp. SDUM112013]|uniref:phospholipase D family protein n=1 Tax=Shimia sp. SDUM112013 TaxID=3136160 RepID=UPI0032EF65B3